MNPLAINNDEQSFQAYLLASFEHVLQSALRNSQDPTSTLSLQDITSMDEWGVAKQGLTNSLGDYKHVVDVQHNVPWWITSHFTRLCQQQDDLCVSLVGEVCNIVLENHLFHYLYAAMHIHDSSRFDVECCVQSLVSLITRSDAASWFQDALGRPIEDEEAVEGLWRRAIDRGWPIFRALMVRTEKITARHYMYSPAKYALSHPMGVMPDDIFDDVIARNKYPYLISQRETLENFCRFMRPSRHQLAIMIEKNEATRKLALETRVSTVLWHGYSEDVVAHCFDVFVVSDSTFWPRPDADAVCEARKLLGDENYDVDILAALLFALPELLLRPPRGSTFLHQVLKCAQFDLYPPKVVELIIQAGINRVPDFLWQLDDFGNTIMHAACSQAKPNVSARYDVASVLLKYEPLLAHAINKKGESPLTLACKNRGWNDDHHQDKLKVVQCLLELSPSELLQRQHRMNDTPLQKLFSGSMLKQEGPAAFVSSNVVRYDRYGPTPDPDMAPGHLERIQALVELVAVHVAHANGETLVADAFDPEQIFLGLIVADINEQQELGYYHEFYPGCGSFESQNGNFALHALLQLPKVKVHNLMAALVQAHPQCVPHINDADLLPLHAALQASVPWHRGISLLVDICPSSVTVSRPRDGLRPFEIAATCYRLGKCFQLLKRCPDLVVLAKRVHGDK